MTLKFCSTPQVVYGKQPGAADNWRDRFPANAQPIATAPERGASPVWVFEPDGSARRAVHYRGGWQKVDVQHDPRDGTARQVMTGEAIMNPVCWASS
jgi:hypothetical protein